MESLHHSYTALTAVLVIAEIALATIIVVIVLRRRYHLAVPENFTFHNPLFFSKDQSRSDTIVVAEEVNPKLIVSKWRILEM